MIPTQSAVRAYDVSHLTEHAAHWRELAERRRSVVGTINAQANSLDWQGQGDEAMKAAMARHRSTAEEEAELLHTAAQTAEGGASVLHQQQQSILYSVAQARQQGFAVGEDWSVTDAMYSPGSMGWYARLPTAQAHAANLRTQAGQFMGQEYQTAADVAQAAGDLGGEGAVDGHIQAVGNPFKTNGPTPTPQPQPSPPQTGEPIKLPPHATPPQVITAEPPISGGPQHKPGFEGCSGEEQFKDFLAILAGTATIGLSIPGEAVTGGAATIGILGGGSLVTDGVIGLDECSK